MRILTLVRAKVPEKSAQLSLEQSDKSPRVSLYAATLNSDLLDQSSLAAAPFPRRLLYRFLPTSFSLALEAFFLKGKYDAVVSWAESYGLLFALLLKMTRSRVPHVALFSWISKPKKARFLRLVHSHISRIVLWSTVQMEFAERSLGIPRSKLFLTRWGVDHLFWRPITAEIDMICSAGREMRDYATLIEALEPLDIRCHIAAYRVQGKKDKWFEHLTAAKSLPSHITVGSKSVTEMRQTYARSLFVVIPLLPEADTDNGVTVITEAMAMGKAVICSQTAGQVDVIQNGRTGIFVPPGNPLLLREAIKYLWANPDVAREMGREGRKYVEETQTLDRFVNDIKSVVEDVLLPGSESRPSSL